MDHIGPIWMIIEDRWHGEFTVMTQKDTHGYHFRQHHKFPIHTYHN